MRVSLTPRAVRRLLAADGYLDLGMPEQAVEELDRIDAAGPLEGPRQLLRGIAMKQLDDHTTAIQHLEKAARLMPSPVRKFAWRELAESYEAVGSEDLAALATKLAGPIDYQLRISLPFSDLTIESTARSAGPAAL
jgi:predicted Zn-dependent protease